MENGHPTAGPSLILPDTSDAKVRRLYEYWRSICPAGARLPGRQHVDPASMPDLLPWVWMLDVQRTPIRFKYRLLGSEQVLAIGSHPIGRWLDEVHPEFVTHSHYGDYVEVVEHGRPSFRYGLPAFHTEKRFATLQRLLLPLARDGTDIDMILAITVYMGVEDPARFT